MRKAYLDITELTEKEAISIFVGDDTEIILAGTTIYSMDVNLKKIIKKYADNYDIQFIFDDCIPNVEFYTIPQVDIMAIDSIGGYIGTIGQQCDIESDAPICYISSELECFIVAENGIDFLKNMESWKENLKFYDKVRFYLSKTEAEKELEFIDLPIIKIDKNNK